MGCLPPLLALLAILAAVIAVVGPRLYEYSLSYYRQVYLPASGGPGAPTYYYLDWREDWRDPEELREAVVHGPMVTSRAARVSGAEAGEGEWLYDPIGLIQGGLALHDQVLDEIAAGRRTASGELLDDRSSEGHGLDRQRILVDQAEWLHRAAEWLPDSVAVWSIPWRAGRYDLSPPWISALSQGQAISLLVRTATWDRPQDLDLARAAVRSLLDPRLPIVLSDESGIRFLEEFPVEPPSEVLNGCLFAWLGLWDYVRATGDEPLRRTCLALLDRIEAQGADYELRGFGLSGWTSYDAHGSRPTSPGYQELHAALAEAIGHETGREFWSSRGERWRKSVDSPLRRVYVFFRVGLDKLTAGNF